MAYEPISRKSSNLLQRSRLFEEVRSPPDDLELLLDTQLLHRFVVHADHREIFSTYDQERGSLNTGEVLSGEVGTSAARDDRANVSRSLGRRDQRSAGPPVLAPK